MTPDENSKNNPTTSSTLNKQQLKVKIPSADTDEPRDASTTGGDFKPVIVEDVIQCDKVKNDESAQHEMGMFDDDNQLNHKSPHQVPADDSSSLKAARDAIQQNQRESSCLLYTSPSPRDKRQSRMPSSA